MARIKQSRLKSRSKALKRPVGRPPARRGRPPTVLAANRQRRFNWRPINNLWLWANIAFGVMGIVLGWFLMSHASYEVWLNYLTKDELLSQTGTVLAPAARVVADIQIRWLLILSLIAGLVGPGLYLVAVKRGGQRRPLMVKWLDFGLVGGLISVTAGFLVGVRDVATLILLLVVVWLSSLLGWLTSKTATFDAPAKPVIYRMTMLTALLPWLVIAAYTAATPLYGLARLPWYGYGVLAIGLLMQLAVLADLRQSDPAGQSKGRYWVISLASKLAITLVLIIGLYK